MDLSKWSKVDLAFFIAAMFSTSGRRSSGFGKVGEPVASPVMPIGNGLRKAQDPREPLPKLGNSSRNRLSAFSIEPFSSRSFQLSFVAPLSAEPCGHRRIPQKRITLDLVLTARKPRLADCGRNGFD
jgi:hypothetical protein